jgi:hypothetical protein
MNVFKKMSKHNESNIPPPPLFPPPPSFPHFLNVGNPQANQMIKKIATNTKHPIRNQIFILRNQRRDFNSVDLFLNWNVSFYYINVSFYYINVSLYL